MAYAARTRRGDRVTFKPYFIVRPGNGYLERRAATVVGELPARANELPRLLVEVDDILGHTVEVPASAVNYQRDSRGRRLRAVIDEDA